MVSMAWRKASGNMSTENLEWVRNAAIRLGGALKGYDDFVAPRLKQEAIEREARRIDPDAFASGFSGDYNAREPRRKMALAIAEKTHGR